jgi:hypothetical protein
MIVLHASSPIELPNFSCHTSRLSTHEGKSRRPLHQFEHSVDTDVDAAQHHLDAFVVSYARERFHRFERTRIDPEHGREIQNHFALGAVQFTTRSSSILRHTAIIAISTTIRYAVCC